jgi:hypothetical protein
MNHRYPRLLRALVGLVVMALAGCAYIPHDGDRITGNTAYFIGFTTAPAAPVRIQVRRWFGWQTIATLTSSPTAFGSSAPTFSNDLYQWSVNATVPPTAFDSAGRVTLRAQQAVGVNWVPMYMYDQSGWECLVSRYIAAGTGELDVWSAGIECSRTSGTELHQITLHR